MTLTAVEESRLGGGGRTSAGFRTDIQGLRAVAVGLVLAFHAGLTFVPGGYVGVDVFFVLSGFLITGLIVREVELTGRLDLRRFFARRIRRLLPAAALTTVGVAVLTVKFLPVTRWESIAGDIAASTVYMVNWRFADQAVDYMGADDPASPLQHFWSLAIEEQFYIVWPVLVVGLVFIARRGVPRVWLAWVLGLVLVASLALSVIVTASDPGKAYFVTTTRAWELAAGGLLALGAVRLARLPMLARSIAGWAGLVLIVVAALRLTPETAFPGIAAALPVLGALLVLISGLGDGRGSLRLLSVPVMQDIGALSYSLYLWHWPFLVVAAAHWGDLEGRLSTSIGVLTVLASAVPAWLSFRVVERPIHMSPRLARSLKGSFLMGLVAVLLGLAAAYLVDRAVPESRELSAGENPGAAALVPDGESWRDPTTTSLDRIVPAPADAADDFDFTCRTTAIQSDKVEECALYPDAPGRHVVAVGDSHLQHWLPAIRYVAEREDWRVTVLVKQACPLTAFAVPREGAVDATCVAWNARVADRLLELAPDVVLVGAMHRTEGYDPSGKLFVAEEGLEVVATGFAQAWAPVMDRGASLVAIRDTPARIFNVPECLARPGVEVDDCALPATVDVETWGTSLVRAAEIAGSGLIDLNDLVCPTEPCPAVVGGVLAYRDTDHLSRTFVESLAPFFHERLLRELER